MKGYPRNPFVRFLVELKRRRVLQVAGAYLVGGWVAIEVASLLVPELMLPAWTTRAVIVLVVVGLPLALVLAWAFDFTSEGVRRTADEPPRETADLPPAGPATRTPDRLRPWAVGLGLGGLILLTAGAFWGALNLRQFSAPEAAALIPEIEALAVEGRYREAYDLALRVEKRLPEDAALASLWLEISDLLTVRTRPEGAEVVARVVSTDSLDVDPLALGTAPVERLRIPRVPHHLTVELDGYGTEERLVSSELGRVEQAFSRDGRHVVIQVELVPEEELPAGMVFVPGSPYMLVSPEIPPGLTAPLDPYFIGRYEVTNAEFRDFVTSGGYSRPALWPTPIVMSGTDTLSFGEMAARFVDRTGLPGPRDWSSQLPPRGREDHPVTGVTWYEAAAYCASRETRLPSIFQWEKAARDGHYSHYGVVMPWGLATSREASRPDRANFAGPGTEPVDARPSGISPWGAYAMAGNVKEWLANPVGDARAVTGGSWQDPAYLFSELAVVDPGFDSPALGFRCVRVRASDGRLTRDQGTFDLDLDRRTPSYDPVDRKTFQALLGHYRYDPRPLESNVVERLETDDWVRERVSYAGAEQERVLAYLWLPKSTPAPHQVILYVPGADAFFGAPLPDHVEAWLGGLVRSGRAVFTVVLKGMGERPFPQDYAWPDPPSVRFRDLMVHHATELRLGLDYLETRPDVDTDRLAYAGLSFGAGSRLSFAAVDDRYEAVILIGGGIDERVKPTLPEADNVNFAPYIRPPTLLLNGRHDEEHPWLTRALPLWNLLTEPKKLVLVEGVGHMPPAEVVIPTVDRFLNETLGPVRR